MIPRSTFHKRGN